MVDLQTKILMFIQFEGKFLQLEPKTDSVNLRRSVHVKSSCHAGGPRNQPVA
jgi:hypothetical protein